MCSPGKQKAFTQMVASRRQAWDGGVGGGTCRLAMRGAGKAGCFEAKVLIMRTFLMTISPEGGM